MESEEHQAIERAKKIIVICGGFDKVSIVTARSKSRVYSWTYPVSKHGTGGIIPVKCQFALLAHARDVGLGLDPSDFFPAMSVPHAESVA